MAVEDCRTWILTLWEFDKRNLEMPKIHKKSKKRRLIPTFDFDPTKKKEQVFLFIFRFGPPFILFLNLFLIFIFIVIEDNGNVYYYFSAADTKHSEIIIRTLFALSVFSSVVCVSLLTWSFSLDNWYLLFIFNGIGKIMILCEYICQFEPQFYGPEPELLILNSDFSGWQKVSVLVYSDNFN